MKSPAGEYPTDGEELPVQEEVFSSFSNIARPLRLVIYDRAALSRFTLKPLHVDFERQMVLLAALGPAPSPECGVRIRRVWREGSRLRVDVEQFYPEASVARRHGSASPYHAVVVPRCELPVERFGGAVPSRAFEEDVLPSP